MSETLSSIALAVGTEVRGQLARQRKTQLSLARHLHMSPNTLARRINGESAFRLDELEATAEFLGVPVATLLPSERVAS